MKLINMNKKISKILCNDRGVTGIDLVLALVIMVTFIGIITGLMSSIYKTSIEIQKSANASSYATIILEKVDEKAYEDITNDFCTNLLASGEIAFDENFSDEYTIDFKVEPLRTVEEDVLKKVSLSIVYNVGSEQKTISFTKLKVKEIYK